MASKAVETSVALTESSTTEVQSDVPKRPASWRRFLGLFWDSFEASPRERKYVQKVDLFLFSYIMLGYFIKYLDQQNYSNAYVSGMSTDLHMGGNDRNLLVTFFSIGIIVGSVPSQMIQLKYVRPSIWIPSCELIWSILVMSMAGAKNVKTLYVLRFFIGLFESCSFPGYAALLGSWYGPDQLAKRVALFEQSSAIASMFSGYLQAALYKGLNHKGGLAGWRWLFIFDAIISIPIAVWGFFAIPDLPSNTRAFYLNQDDRDYGIERIEKIGRAPPVRFTLKVLKGVFASPYLYAFLLPYLLVAEASYGTNYFNLWLKAEGYSVVQINLLPTAGSAISVVASLFFGIIADRTRTRLYVIDVIMILVLVGNILLSIWHLPKGVLYLGFMLEYVGAAAQPILIAWGQEMTQGNANLRQLLVATGNILTYTFSASIPLVLFPTYDAPKYKYGYQIMCMFGVLAIISSHTLDLLHKWQVRRKGPAVVPAIESAGSRDSLEISDVRPHDWTLEA